MRDIKDRILNNNIIVYTDGASRGNGEEHSVAAYAYYLLWHSLNKCNGKAFYDKTNNQMEILAVISALKNIKRNDLPIIVHSDSALVVNCYNNGWYKKWCANGWTKKGGLKNADLWKELIKETKRFEKIKFVKVKGHSNDELNNLVDKKCNELMDQLLNN